MIAVIIAWVIGIGCIFLMKKIQPGGWIAYAIYVLVVLILLQKDIKHTRPTEHKQQGLRALLIQEDVKQTYQYLSNIVV